MFSLVSQNRELLQTALLPFSRGSENRAVLRTVAKQ